MIDRLLAALPAAARACIDEARARGPAALPEVLPGLARRVGRTPLGGGMVTHAFADGRAALVDLDSLRACDAAGCVLLAQDGVEDAALVELYLRGDIEERTIVLRALGVRPVTGATLRLLEEIQRSNVESHFAAAVCDSNLVLRASEHAAFGRDAFNRVMLKAAFLGFPLDRVLEASAGANAELSRMLQDLATEREAAGRAVWPDTWRMIAHAPAPGSIARIIGGIEHGDDRVRLAAAHGLTILNSPDLRRFAEERLPREPRPAIQDALKRCLI